MAHGGYGKHRVAGRKPDGNHRRSKALAVDKKAGKTKTKPKSVSLKNQIRSIERMLRKDLPPEVREAQEKKLEDFKKQQEHINCEAVKREALVRGKKIRFFERRKIERSIRRLEKQIRASSAPAQQAEIFEQLSKLKEDLEYVKFFPKTEVYVSLFIGDDDPDIVDDRERLRKQIKANLIAAAANGKDLEETGSDDDGLLDLSEDDFFLGGSSSNEADADDEWTDKSMREQATCASGKAASGMSSDERNQKHISDRALMPPPRPSNRSHTSSSNVRPNFGGSINKKAALHRAVMSMPSNTSNSVSQSSFRNRRSLNSPAGQSSNLSSSSDAWKPRRKRRPKKKKQQS